MVLSVTQTVDDAGCGPSSYRRDDGKLGAAEIHLEWSSSSAVERIFLITRALGKSFMEAVRLEAKEVNAGLRILMIIIKLLKPYTGGTPTLCTGL